MKRFISATIIAAADFWEGLAVALLAFAIGWPLAWLEPETLLLIKSAAASLMILVILLAVLWMLWEFIRRPAINEADTRLAKLEREKWEWIHSRWESQDSSML